MMHEKYENAPEKICCRKCSGDLFFHFEKTFKDGTKHIQANCAKCGGYKQYVKQESAWELDLREQVENAMDRDEP